MAGNIINGYVTGDKGLLLVSAGREHQFALRRYDWHRRTEVARYGGALSLDVTADDVRDFWRTGSFDLSNLLVPSSDATELTLQTSARLLHYEPGVGQQTIRMQPGIRIELY